MEYPTYRRIYMQKLGFSLFEMLIVLLIFSIILSFSYPSFQHYLIRAHRLEGQLALLDLATHMEQYFAKHGTYTQATLGTNSEHDVLSTPMTTQGYYTLVIHDSTDLHFNLQAVPQGVQGQTDKHCQTLQFNDQGMQSIVPGPGGSPTGSWEECWS